MEKERLERLLPLMQQLDKEQRKELEKLIRKKLRSKRRKQTNGLSKLSEN